MKTINWWYPGAVAAGLAACLAYSSSQAAHHKTEQVGEYSTRVAESRLFVGGTRLRCDLFFSAPNGAQSVAKKDSLVVQQVPAFVWQFSGLLPVADYRKTIAIHSTATDNKIERWQDVQHTFYEGLRAEGAATTDAKIAFAGAYAFAPRWPFIELVEIPDELAIPDTKLYAVAATDPARKGLTVDDYRSMARDIIDNPQNVTLQDIRGVVDAVDAGEGGYEESGLLISVVDKIKSVAKHSHAGSEIVDLEPVKVELGTMAKQDGDKAELSPEANSDEWLTLPDGSSVLKNVSELAQQS
jgi:hypothetical protein